MPIYNLILDKALSDENGHPVYDIYLNEDQTPKGQIRLGDDDLWRIAATGQTFSSATDAVRAVCGTTAPI